MLNALLGSGLFTLFTALPILKAKRADKVKKKICEFAIVVHGGAFNIPDSIYEASESGVRNAVCAGYKVLKEGGNALDAVEAAVNSLENDPTFDAGYGSVLTQESEIEMDAMIMDGTNLDVGGIACVKTVRNPISLARKVKDQTNHTLIVGVGADKIARKFGIEKVGTTELTTQAAIDELALFHGKYDSTVNNLFNTHVLDNDVSSMCHDTVGCVCIDRHGNLAAGTSTGGITAKWGGRVGDSPIIGSGAYADNMKGAVSTTGHGESIAKLCLAKSAVDRMSQLTRVESDRKPRIAIEQSLEEMRNRVDGCGGAIGVSPTGHVGIGFTTPRMCWASVQCLEGEIVQGYSGVDPGQRNEFTP